MFKITVIFLIIFTGSIFAAEAPSASKMKDISDNEVVMRCFYCGTPMIDYDPVTYKQCYHLLPNGQKFFSRMIYSATQAKVAEMVQKMRERHPQSMQALCTKSDTNTK